MRPYHSHFYHHPRPIRPYHYRPLDFILYDFLGVTIGSSLAYSLDCLASHNYIVVGYDDNTVFLRDVYQLGYYWPDATFYYDGGRLAASEYIYSTSYYSTSRYDRVYRSLVHRYGNPYRDGSAYAWYGNSGYITLDLRTDYAADGSRRYFTVLTYGR